MDCSTSGFPVLHYLLELAQGASSCPLSQWYHPTISSFVASFSSCLQSFPASGSFPMSQLCIRRPKYWSFSYSTRPSNEYSRLISFTLHTTVPWIFLGAEDIPNNRSWNRSLKGVLMFAGLSGGTKWRGQGRTAKIRLQGSISECI